MPAAATWRQGRLCWGCLCVGLAVRHLQVAVHFITYEAAAAAIQMATGGGACGVLAIYYARGAGALLAINAAFAAAIAVCSNGCWPGCCAAPGSPRRPTWGAGSCPMQGPVVPAAADWWGCMAMGAISGRSWPVGAGAGARWREPAPRWRYLESSACERCWVAGRVCLGATLIARWKLLPAPRRRQAPLTIAGACCRRHHAIRAENLNRRQRAPWRWPQVSPSTVDAADRRRSWWRPEAAIPLLPPAGLVPGCLEGLLQVPLRGAIRRRPLLGTPLGNAREACAISRYWAGSALLRVRRPGNTPTHKAPSGCRLAEIHPAPLFGGTPPQTRNVPLGGYRPGHAGAALVTDGDGAARPASAARDLFGEELAARLPTRPAGTAVAE